MEAYGVAPGAYEVFAEQSVIFVKRFLLLLASLYTGHTYTERERQRETWRETQTHRHTYIHTVPDEMARALSSGE